MLFRTATSPEAVKSGEAAVTVAQVKEKLYSVCSKWASSHGTCSVANDLNDQNDHQNSSFHILVNLSCWQGDRVWCCIQSIHCNKHHCRVFGIDLHDCGGRPNEDSRRISEIWNSCPPVDLVDWHSLILNVECPEACVICYLECCKWLDQTWFNTAGGSWQLWYLVRLCFLSGSRTRCSRTSNRKDPVDFLVLNPAWKLLAIGHWQRLCLGSWQSFWHDSAGSHS